MAQPTPTILVSSIIPPERGYPSATTPSEPSQAPQQSDSMEEDPISAYYDPDPEEHRDRISREQGDQKRKDEQEKTPAAEIVPQKVAREEIDLNESAQKRNLMTDEEFDSIVNKVNRREEGTASMAEGLDLASRAVGESEEADTGTTPEGQVSRPVGEVDEAHDRERVCVR